MSVFLAMALRTDEAPSSRNWRPHMTVKVDCGYCSVQLDKQTRLREGVSSSYEDALATQLRVSRVYSATRLVIPKRP